METAGGSVDPQQAFEEILSGEKYALRLSEAALYGRDAFTLDFEDVLRYDLELAKGLVERPGEFLKHASNAAMQRLNVVDPEYAGRVEGLSVRLSALPNITAIREIGAKHINKLVMVEGIVVRASPVQPMVVTAAFRCRACETITHVPHEGTFLRQPYLCQNPDCHRKGPFDFVEAERVIAQLIREGTLYEPREGYLKKPRKLQNNR